MLSMLLLNSMCLAALPYSGDIDFHASKLPLKKKSIGKCSFTEYSTYRIPDDHEMTIRRPVVAQTPTIFSVAFFTGHD